MFDEMLLFGGDEALAVAQLVIPFAVEDLDEFLSDVVLLPTGHADVELRQAALHGDSHPGTEQFALFAADLRIAKVDRDYRLKLRIDEISRQPAQALLTARALVVETYQIVIRFLAEDFALALRDTGQWLLSFRSHVAKLRRNKRKSN